MDIAVCVKLAPDAEDIDILRDGSISLERAEWVIGGFDLQALEAGVRLSEGSSGKVAVISAGPAKINQSRLKKDILSRGPHELYMVVDEALADADTATTGTVLAAAVRKYGPFDLVLCGEGSADLYFQQTGMQLGEMLELPVLNFISKIELENGKLKVERTLEDEVEMLEIPLPAVLSVTTDINTPRLPTMKEILKANQKPMRVENLAELGFAEPPSRQTEILSTRAPEQVARKQVVIPGTATEAAQALAGYLKKEGLI